MQVEVNKFFSRPQHPWNSGGVHPFMRGDSGLRIQKASHVNNDSTPVVFLLCMKVIELGCRD
jgi:hypothetical protein